MGLATKRGGKIPKDINIRLDGHSQSPPRLFQVHGDVSTTSTRSSVIPLLEKPSKWGIEQCSYSYWWCWSQNIHLCWPLHHFQPWPKFPKWQIKFWCLHQPQPRFPKWWILLLEGCPPSCKSWRWWETRLQACEPIKEPCCPNRPRRICGVWRIILWHQTQNQF